MAKRGCLRMEKNACREYEEDDSRSGYNLRILLNAAFQIVIQTDWSWNLFGLGIGSIKLKMVICGYMPFFYARIKM